MSLKIPISYMVTINQNGTFIALVNVAVSKFLKPLKANKQIEIFLSH